MNAENREGGRRKRKIQIPGTNLQRNDQASISHLACLVLESSLELQGCGLVVSRARQAAINPNQSKPTRINRFCEKIIASQKTVKTIKSLANDRKTRLKTCQISRQNKLFFAPSFQCKAQRIFEKDS
jgi:hypothetical protein